MRFVTRRIRNIILAIVAVIGLVLLVRTQHQTLQDHAFTTGYLLITAVFFLAGYNLRKKIPFLPLGTSAFWLQLHIYVGFITVAIFALHAGLRIPNGVLESSLAALYLLVASSGIYGLYITRTIPRKLANLNEEIIYERIPAFRRQVAARSRTIALTADSVTSATVAQFYLERLDTFFERPRGWLYRLWPTSRMRRDLIDDIRDLQRYCSKEEQQVAWSLADMVRKKDDLDYHEAQQWKLKAWLFVHIGLTYSLLIVATLHGILAHAFHGGLR